MASETSLKGLSLEPVPPAAAVALTKTPPMSLTSIASVVGSPTHEGITPELELLLIVPLLLELVVVDVYPGHPTCPYLLQSPRSTLQPPSATSAAAPPLTAQSAPRPTSQSTRRIRSSIQARPAAGPG